MGASRKGLATIFNLRQDISGEVRIVEHASELIGALVEFVAIIDAQLKLPPA